VGTKRPPQWILDIAKKLDTPEMRKLYRDQKVKDETLDERIDKFTEENQDLFDHMESPNDVEK
jgi:hypothetical protein